LRAEKDLLALALRFGSTAEQAEIEARIARSSTALDRLWREDIGLYASMDLVTHTLCPVGTSAGFLPLFSGHGQARMARLAATLSGWAGRVTRLVPSADPAFSGFEAQRYWRGPVWAVVNWMIADGFAAAGDAASASRIRTDTVALIETAGLSEYFEPITGQGIGGADFSWTAAIYLMWSRGGA
jgi:glycogen debranching enzyme